MRKPYALINGSRPNDRASEEMPICIFCSYGCNPLPAWQRLHVIRRAYTRMFQIDASEIFFALPRGKKDLSYFNLCHGIVEANDNFSPMHSIIRLALLPNTLRNTDRKHR